MAILNKDLITKNLFVLLEFSGISDISYANLLNVSSKQIKRIKKGEAEFSIDNINKSCDFFKQSLERINNKEIIPDFNFRKKLLDIHKDNTEYSAILEKRPSITYAINFELLNNEKFLKGKLTVKEIGEIFRDRGWIFTSSYISLALKRNLDKINIEPHPSRKAVFVYSKKF